MTAEELLVQVLTRDPVLAPLLGQRVYDGYAPNIDPTAGYPHVCYTVVSRRPIQTLAGATKTFRAEYTMCVYALRSSDIRSVVGRLFAMAGPRSESGGATLRWMWVNNETTDDEYTNELDDRAVRESMVDVVLWYEEA